MKKIGIMKKIKVLNLGKYLNQLIENFGLSVIIALIVLIVL